MLMIRLQRVGRKNDPSFRVVVGDKRNAAKSGKFLDVVGYYDARRGEPQLNIDKIKKWMEKGAQVSGTVHNLLVDAKVIDGKKINVLPKKTVPVKPAEEVKSGTAAEVEGNKERIEPVASEAKTEEVKTEEAPTVSSEEGGNTTDTVA
jgi:small subunit ribosomal protein S16